MLDNIVDFIIGLFVVFGLVVFIFCLAPILTIIGLIVLIWFGSLCIIWLIEDFINKKKKTENENT